MFGFLECAKLQKNIMDSDNSVEHAGHVQIFKQSGSLHGGTNLDVPPTPFLKFLLYRFSDD